MAKNYKTRKVFDCQWDPGMPDDVMRSFRRIFEGTPNDVVVEYTVNGEVFSKKDENSEWAQDKRKLDAWLIKNGAKNLEDVLIKHWW